MTPELQAELIKYIKAGNYIETACSVVGVAKQTFFRWMKEGAQRISPETIEFRDSVEKALGAAEARDVAIIGKAAEKNWTAAAWRLERKFPDRWGRTDKLDLKHSGGIGFVEHKVTAEELTQFKANFGTFFPDLVAGMEDGADDLLEESDQ